MYTDNTVLLCGGWVGGAGVSAPLKSISDHLFGCECETCL